MALYRHSALAAVLAAGVESARILKKKRGGRLGDCMSKYDGMPLMKLNSCSSVEETIAQLTEAGCYILDEAKVEQLACTDAEVVCSGEVAGLVKNGIATVVNPDAGALWRGEGGVTRAFNEEALGVASDFYSDWRDLDTIEERVKSLVAASSSGATYEVAGKSLQGRDMNIVRLRGRGYSPEKKMARIVLTFNLHAREWITGMAGVFAVEHMLKKAEEDFGFFDRTEVVIMAMANPDGFHYSTVSDRLYRKNMRNNSGSWCGGVDLNRNFDAYWGKYGSASSPCADTYRGPTAMSEPESEVIAKVMEEAPMSVYIDVHSFGELVITAPSWNSTRSARHAEYRQVGGSIQAAIKSVHGRQYTEGPGQEVLYTVSGSTTDYADDRGAFGICFEVRPPRGFGGGGGFVPNKREILPTAEETFEGILVAIQYAQDPSSLPPVPPTPSPPPFFFR